MKALARAQWADQVFAKAFNARSRVPLNIYMPGLVRTKILQNEPRAQRLAVAAANLLIGITPEKAARQRRLGRGRCRAQRPSGCAPAAGSLLASA